MKTVPIQASSKSAQIMEERDYGVEIVPIVVAAVIFDGDGKVLIGQRAEGKMFAGQWEFPGGSQEPGESSEEATKREIKEELSAEIFVGEELFYSEYDYKVHGLTGFRFFQCRITNGEIVCNPKIHQDLRWVAISELGQYDLVEADRAFARELAKRHNSGG